MFVVVLLLAAALTIHSYGNRPWNSSSEAFVSATPAATSIGSRGQFGEGGQLLSYEAEAHQITIDLAAIVTSRTFATQVSRWPALRSTGWSASQIQSDLSASVNARLLTIDASAPNREEANRIVGAADDQILFFRQRYIGPFEAERSNVHIVSPPNAGRAPGGHIATTFGLRVLLGALVALALALGWDYLDDSVHSAADLESWLDVPVLATIDD